jgi:hypothetical protein
MDSALQNAAVSESQAELAELAGLAELDWPPSAVGFQARRAGET